MRRDDITYDTAKGTNKTVRIREPGSPGRKSTTQEPLNQRPLEPQAPNKGELDPRSQRELPPDFRTQMTSWLGPEFSLFAQALTEPPQRAVRLHRFTTVKLSSQPLSHTQLESPYAISQNQLTVPPSLLSELGDAVPWQLDGFYVPLDSKLGKLVYHEAGAYYIQEPSAMAVVNALNPQPGERILDLAAAPGGKTTAIGRTMRGQGLLVANEIHPVRVLTLAQNVERLGIPAVIVNETPERLASLWQQEFDAVLVDAPCSGEGMFRKDVTALQEWSSNAPEACSLRQREILRSAVQMVRPGGRLVYSTCTFNPVENEQIVAWLMQEFGMTVMELPLWEGWVGGRPEWAGGIPEMTRTRRLWPHKGRGEGHFVALLEVAKHREVPGAMVTRGEAGLHHQEDLVHTASNHPHIEARRLPGREGRVNGGKYPGQNKRAKRPDDTSLAAVLGQGQTAAWESWLATIVHQDLPARWRTPVILGNQVFADERHGLPTDGLRLLRPGIALATVNNGRFEPHHSLALAVRPDLTFTQPLSEQEALAYLRGESLPESSHLGWVLLTFDGLALGWGKSVPGRTNNLYPKGLRRTDLTPAQPG